jgi:hypothetical protein
MMPTVLDAGVDLKNGTSPAWNHEYASGKSDGSSTVQSLHENTLGWN